MAAQASLKRRFRVSRSIALLIAFGWGCGALVAGCAGPTRVPRGALRISQIVELGDPRRQASMRLVVEGLDAEIAAANQRALARYERAVQIDPSNAFAYLALARFYAATRDSERALEHLDRARSLLDPDGALYRGTAPHLRGLRGWALSEAGRFEEAGPPLEQARRLAPSVWGDGRLDASELR